MVLKIEKGLEGRVLVLRLSGRLQSEHVEQVESEMKGSSYKVALDLKNLKLVDLESVRFLGVCEANGTELRNCSTYIRDWILREKPACE